ncbi:MAG: bifunctional 4-hydroxy-2-oxoglutarate aldolase/2-dehydro-3-deoxy-phosphogluconate aldolase [Synechococcales bacterium]|nr:bifunctional 4-hydroxy-2-oxoglutarate aldolase/2-dehydro-3-deoxy-phosphogluconate aldolase [Synechococcales bacterium]
MFITNETWLALLKQHRAIAVIRAPELGLGRQMARSVAAAGMGLIEVTWNSDRPAELVGQLRADLPDCTVGVGTILEAGELYEAVQAGAQFAFSPHTSLPLIQAAQRLGVPMIPGALSPTEIVTAWQAGAACVKVFPVKVLGGTDYIRCLQGPLAAVPLIPTGGVTLDNAQAFLEAGAIAVGLSSHLFPKGAIAEQNWSLITEQATTLVQGLIQRELIRV